MECVANLAIKYLTWYMDICLDLGNTFGKMRIDAAGSPPVYYKQLSDTAIQELIQRLAPENIIYCDVRGTAADLIGATGFSGRLLRLTHQLPIPLKNCYQTPHTLGMDRLAAALGAWQQFPNRQTLVIDAGTCITYDFVTASAEFLGGIISPGLQMRLKAMHTFTARLPLIDSDFAVPPPLVGQTTADAMLSGAFHGLSSEMNGIIHQYEAIFGRFNILLSGGDALFFEKTIKETNFVNENVVLDGLRAALNFNLANFRF
ncbi:type III pantothenate kinase [Rhodoflexus sp.]